MAPPPSKGALGLMKLSVVLKLGVVVSEDEEAISANTFHFSPCHSPPSLKILLSVTRELVSLEKRKFGSSSSFSRFTGITPRSAAWIDPKLVPPRDPKLIVSNSSGTEISFNALTPDA